MKSLIKPNKLNNGDKIATISLSWGIAGDEECLWRYEIGKKRLEKEFGLQVIDKPNSLKGSKFIRQNPEARADDLMWAFDLCIYYSCSLIYKI